jgi:hypothetical protein
MDFPAFKNCGPRLMGVIFSQGNSARYFTCPPTCGSFAKPSNLSGGIGLVSALRERYEGALVAANDEVS